MRCVAPLIQRNWEVGADVAIGDAKGKSDATNVGFTSLAKGPQPPHEANRRYGLVVFAFDNEVADSETGIVAAFENCIHPGVVANHVVAVAGRGRGFLLADIHKDLGFQVIMFGGIGSLGAEHMVVVVPEGRATQT